MKKKGLIKYAVIFPVISATILSALLVVTARPNIHIVLPIKNGTEIAFFDTKAENSDIIDLYDNSADADNQLVGYVKLIGSTIPIRYNSDYSNTASSLSITNGNFKFGETGCICMKAFNDTAKIIESETDIDIEDANGNYKYILVDKFTADNEFKVLNSNPVANKALMIYYQESNGAGFSSDYTVLVYKEIE